MAIDENFIVDDPSLDNPLLMKDGEEYTSEEEQAENEEDTEESRVIWKGVNVD